MIAHVLTCGRSFDVDRLTIVEITLILYAVAGVCVAAPLLAFYVLGPVLPSIH